MHQNESELIHRVERLERRLRATTAAATLLTLGLVIALVSGMGDDGKTDAPGEIKATRITVVDDAGRPRVVIGQDPKDIQRISRSAGITLHDETGAERGGWGTMDDGSINLGLDAPVGVGSPMRDRIGLKVHPNGAATVTLINNQTGIPVRLISEADGSGGVEFLDYDLDARKAFIKRLGYQGETTTEQSLGPG